MAQEVRVKETTKPHCHLSVPHDSSLYFIIIALIDLIPHIPNLLSDATLGALTLSPYDVPTY